MKEKSLFEVLCLVLNKEFIVNSSKLVEAKKLCRDPMFAQNGFIYEVEDSVRDYLWILGNKNNKKGISYVKYNKKTDVIELKRLINDFKKTNYKD